MRRELQVGEFTVTITLPQQDKGYRDSASVYAVTEEGRLLVMIAEPREAERERAGEEASA